MPWLSKTICVSLLMKVNGTKNFIRVSMESKLTDVSAVSLSIMKRHSIIKVYVFKLVQ